MWKNFARSEYPKQVIWATTKVTIYAIIWGVGVRLALYSYYLVKTEAIQEPGKTPDRKANGLLAGQEVAFRGRFRRGEPGILEHFRNTRGLFQSSKGGFFLMKKPLEYVLSVYTNPENALWSVTSLKTLVPWGKRAKFVRVAREPCWAGMQPMKTSNSRLSLAAPVLEPVPVRKEVRCAVRFPLALPVVVSAGREEFAAVTRNVSASGVLFELERDLEVGQCIGFTLRMPGAVLGTPHDVLVRCRGRVVRCCISETQYLAAATIDEYQFAEQ